MDHYVLMTSNLRFYTRSFEWQRIWLDIDTDKLEEAAVFNFSDAHVSAIQFPKYKAMTWDEALNILAARERALNTLIVDNELPF